MIRVVTVFSGYGSQETALNRLNIPFKIIARAEIDKHANKAYEALHGDVLNLGDVTKIEWNTVPDFDLFTYSFPCQDLSSAGLQKGFEEGSGTRSGLLWECKRAIDTKLPKYLLMENVSALTHKKNMPTFRRWQNHLASLGYNNFVQILNAKDYGVPQSRDRVFMVSILGDEWFNFPKPIPLTKCLEDVLEDNIPDKYYLSQKMIDCFLNRNDIAKQKGNGFKFEPNDTNKPCKCITTLAGSRSDDNYIMQIGNIVVQNYKNPNRGRVFDPKGLSPTLTTMQGGGLAPKIIQRPRGFNKGAILDICPTITSSSWETNNLLIWWLEQGAKIRKLTERECFRLMDLTDDEIDKIQAVNISMTQQYKLAGNSIVVNVLVEIFKQLFSEQRQTNLTLFG